MKISFEHYAQQAKLQESAKLFALIAGIRGSGKSTALGTLGGKTFIIASAMESHSIQAAKLYGQDNILSAFYDIDDNNKQMKPDAALLNLHEILDFLLKSPELTETIDAVAIDSVSAIDKTLLESSKVLSEKNGFEQMKIMEQEHLRIAKKLKELHRRGLHVLATMPIMASFDDDGLYVTAKPEIRGVTATSNIAGIFDDVLVVANRGEDYVFQMNLMIKKVGKEVSGADKQIVFHPRITGLSRQDIISISPEQLLPADLNYIYQLKLAKGASK